MSRVLFATIGSLGDLHPLISVGLKLRERGHHVSFCTSAWYQSKIEALGFEFQPLRPDISPNTPDMLKLSKEIMDSNKGADLLLRGFLFPNLRATFDDLMEAVTGDAEVDLLVTGEIVYAAPVVAEKMGILWASCTLSPMSFFSAFDPPVLPPCPRFSLFLRRLGPPTNRLVNRLIKFSTRTWSEPVRQLRAELKLPPGQDPIYEGKYSPHLVLAMFSSTLAQPQPDWPSNTIATGFPFYDGISGESSRASELERFLSEGEPPIVFTLGSAAVFDPRSFYDESIKAACALKRRAILLMGPNPLPPNLPRNLIAFDYIPFSKVFARAAIIVHQGGIGTTAQALRSGRPMLVMPFAFDQPDNAARLERLGVGRTIRRNDYSAARAARELEKLTDSKYTARAIEISHHIQREDGTTQSADALERLLGASSRAPRAISSSA